MGLNLARLGRSGFLLLLLLVLGGCSTTTFLYNRLDFLIPWYLGDYVELDRQQKRSLDDLLDPFLAWHREEELQRYIELLGQIEADLDAPVSAAQVAGHAEALVAAWERIEVRSLEWMLALGEELSDKQLAGFVDKLWEQQREYEEKYLPRSLAEYHEEAYENLLDSIQDSMGRLDWGQRTILEEAAAALQRSDGIWLQERERWVTRMAALLEREPGWQQGVRDMLATRDETTSAEYLAVYEHNTSTIYAAVARVLNTRTDRQDKRLRRRIGDFRGDLETLANSS